MIQAMKIILSKEQANIYWGKKASYSINNDVITLHVKHYNDLMRIQYAAQKIHSLGINHVLLFGENWDVNSCWAFWMGYKDPKNVCKIEWANNLNEIQLKELNHRSTIIDWVRNTINTSAEILGPEQLAQSAVDLLYSIAKERMSYHIIKGDDLLKRGYFGLYTVGRGSMRPPVLLILDFQPNENIDSTSVYTCLVGKGITFDSGGYNIKQSSSMESMKSDMGGAALITGALAFAITRGLNKRVKMWLCCADNLISGNSFKPGDIINYRNGKSVEVINTDAEGRLVLADGLIDASMQKSDLVIDAATLTGAAQIALGNDYHAVLSFDDDLVNRLLTSAAKENELFWRLPLTELHRSQLSSNFAELSNIASTVYPAGASTAAGFLSHFVDNYKKGWLHIDCSANYHKSEVDQWQAGATGLGVFTIANLLTT